MRSIYEYEKLERVKPETDVSSGSDGDGNASSDAFETVFGLAFVCGSFD